VDPMTLYAWESIVANSHSDVLWLTKTQSGYDLWLSRPVPEPSALWALLIPLILCARRARSAAP